MNSNFVHITKRINDLIESKANNDLKPFNLTLRQCGVIKYLIEKEGELTSLKEIERTFEVSQATMQGTVSRLEKKGLVALTVDKNDKRIKNIHLTEEGKASWNELDKSRLKVEKDIFKNFTDEEKETLEALMVKVYRNLV